MRDEIKPLTSTDTDVVIGYARSYWGRLNEIHKPLRGLIESVSSDLMNGGNENSVAPIINLWKELIIKEALKRPSSLREAAKRAGIKTDEREIVWEEGNRG